VVLVDGLVDGNVNEGVDFLIAQDFLINDVFNVLQFFVGDGGEVLEIEA